MCVCGGGGAFKVLLFGHGPFWVLLGLWSVVTLRDFFCGCAHFWGPFLGREGEALPFGGHYV